MNSQELKAFYLKEYERLKEEQKARIAFRDQMIYISLGVIGAVFSFTLENNNYSIALLILPFICIVLGWTYLVNDIKISEIGTYICGKLIPNIIKEELSDMKNNNTDTWENYHSDTPHRYMIKIIQLMVDIVVFCCSAMLSIYVFFVLNDMSIYYILIASFEIISILFLVYLFITNSSIYK